MPDYKHPKKCNPFRRPQTNFPAVIRVQDVFLIAFVLGRVIDIFPWYGIFCVTYLLHPSPPPSSFPWTSRSEALKWDRGDEREIPGNEGAWKVGLAEGHTESGCQGEPFGVPLRKKTDLDMLMCRVLQIYL